LLNEIVDVHGQEDRERIDPNQPISSAFCDLLNFRQRRKVCESPQSPNRE
jgi:hypothetical protein